MPDARTWGVIAVVALATALLRFLPFFLFGGNKKTPKLIEKLSKTLPFAIMGMLVVYCLKDVHFTAVAGWLPALIACALVAVLHVWRRNTLLSILAGTICYMLLVQFVF